MQHQLYALGQLVIKVDDQAVRLAGTRDYALVMFLGFSQGRAVLRDRLVGLLWDQEGRGSRRHGLSQVLYRVRRSLPNLPVIADRYTICLPEGGMWVDARDLLSAVAIGELDRACVLYRGRFADGFYVKGASGFEEWQECVGREVEGAAMRALKGQLASAESVGNWWLVEHTANQLLEHDPYDEVAHTCRIKSIAADGDLDRAQREIDRVADLFRRDLGRPAPPTVVDAADRIRNGSLAARASNSAAEPSELRFVGRRSEFAFLKAAWQAASAGEGRAIQVRGEGGIGKSRLCRHLMRMAAIDGGRIVRGRCYESGAKLPYSGVVDALVQSIRPEDLARVGSPWRGILGNLLPELCAGSDAMDSLAHVEDEGGRRKVLESISQLLLYLSGLGPLLFFLDDMHWADESTSEAIGYAAQRLRHARVLILVAVRPEELPSAPEAVGAPRLTETFGVLHLREMPHDDVADLLSAFEGQVGRNLPTGLKDAVVHKAAGRPFLILELLRHGISSRLNGRSDSVEHTEQLPGSVDLLLGRRLEGLTGDGSRVTGALAVLGGEAAATLVRQVARVGSHNFARTVEELVLKNIALETGFTLAFSHDLMREAVWRRLSFARRGLFHRRAAAVLKRVPSSPPAAIAVHMEAAGQSGRSYRYALAAASASARVHAHAETEFFLRLAVASAQTPDDRLEALDQLAVHLYMIGRYAEVVPVLGELKPWYVRRQSRNGLFISAVVELHVSLAAAETPVSTLILRARELTQLLASVDAPEAAMGSIGWIIETAHDAGQTEFLTELTRYAYSQAVTEPPCSWKAKLLSVCARAFSLYQSTELGCRCAADALDMARGIGDSATEVLALIGYGTAATLNGSYQIAEDCFAQAIAQSQTPHLLHYRQRIWNNYGVLLIEQGRLNEASRLLEAALELASVHDRLFLLGNLALVEVDRAEWTRVEDYAKALAQANQTLQAPWVELFLMTLRGYVALGTGRYDQVRSLRQTVIGAIESGCRLADASHVEIFLARSARLIDEPAGALSFLQGSADACRPRNAGGAARLDLEHARYLAATDPDVAVAIATRVTDWAAQAGAARLQAQAASLIAALNLNGSSSRR